MNKTIIYLTDNSLDENLASMCRKYLVQNAGDNPIISVSQKPIDLGTNICVGEIGRSWLSLYKQQLAGLQEAKTDWIAIAEHDVIYSKDHLDWTPPDDKTFYYNRNHYLVQWSDTNHPELKGMYSRWNRHRIALSQLICSRKLLLELVTSRLELIENGIELIKKYGDPGEKLNPALVTATQKAVSGSSDYIKGLFDRYIKEYKHKIFLTDVPNLDIRHGNNFTGPRRGYNRTYEIPYWGRFKDLWQNQ